MWVVTGPEMQNLDSFVIKELEISGEILMERAGLGVTEWIKTTYPFPRYKRALILCGPGNNGGDGMVCARHLWDSGYEVKLCLLCEEEKYKGEAKKNLDRVKILGLPIIRVKGYAEFKKEVRDFNPDFVVDAIFGTGLKREVKGLFKEVIEDVNSKFNGDRVVSIDIPSGVCSSTGKVFGTAVKSALTITFELPKVGHLFYPGKDFTGKLRVVKIGFPWRVLKEKFKLRELIDEEYAQRVLKPRKGYVHKGTFGHVLVIAGSQGKSGAGYLAALGALRAGAGLVTLASTKTLQETYSKMLPEALTLGLEEDFSGEVSAKAIPKLLEALNGKKAVVVGPGLGLGGGAARIVCELIEKSDVPVVIDADALNILSERPEVFKKAKSKLVLTPHPGEAVRLLKVNKAKLMEDRLEAVRNLCKLIPDGVALLKGPHTVIASVTGEEAISDIDEPGLSQGGNGDVLAGVIGALIAQGYSVFEATCLGVFLHGMSGRVLAKRKGNYGFIASEVANCIPEVIKEIFNEVWGFYKP